MTETKIHPSAIAQSLTDDDVVEIVVRHIENHFAAQSDLTEGWEGLEHRIVPFETWLAVKWAMTGRRRLVIQRRVLARFLVDAWEWHHVRQVITWLDATEQLDDYPS